MLNKWQKCKKILIIRPDNMGDILMSTPAINALKSTFNCHITLLTSSMGKPIVNFIPCIDEVLIFDLPWVKSEIQHNNINFDSAILEIIKGNFDGAVIFNVYSQNPVPSIMLAYLAGIPLRLAYCRENIYGLLTDWLPDKEPFTFILHQVKRDINLVEFIGANVFNDNIVLKISDDGWAALKLKLIKSGVDLNKKWIVAHAGVSEEKRGYPNENWIKLSKQIIAELGFQILFTGAKSETELTEDLAEQCGKDAISLSGKINMEEFILLIKNAPLVISVNTVAIHIAAATNTPIIVLYALTNPQHLPWKGKGKVFPYQVPAQLKSKNEIIKYVAENLQPNVPVIQTPVEVFYEVANILLHDKLDNIPEMFELKKLICTN